MIDPVDELKTRAAILHKRVAAGEAAVLPRLRALPEFGKADAATLEDRAPGMRLKHCLAVVAREHGFQSWDHALRVFRGDATERNCGTLLYDASVRGTLNVWFARYEEARAHLDEVRRARGEHYLLSYQTQFFVVDRHFIEALGWDPADPDWQKLDFDWARPRDPAARRRLYGKRVHAVRGES
jgi:hypothetical protein